MDQGQHSVRGSHIRCAVRLSSSSSLLALHLHQANNPIFRTIYYAQTNSKQPLPPDTFYHSRSYQWHTDPLTEKALSLFRNASIDQHRPLTPLAPPLAAHLVARPATTHQQWIAPRQLLAAPPSGLTTGTTPAPIGAVMPVSCPTARRKGYSC